MLDAVHLDKRITFAAPDGTRVAPPITSYLKAGCGFGGSCFPKDLRALIRWGEEKDCPVDLLSAVMSINERQPVEVLRLLEEASFRPRGCPGRRARSRVQAGN